MNIEITLYYVYIEQTSVTFWGEDRKQEFVKEADKIYNSLSKLSFIDSSSLNRYSEEDLEGVVNYQTFKIYDFDINQLILDKDQLIELAVSGIKHQVKQVVKTKSNITDQLIELAEKPIKLIQEEGSTNNYNTKCEVHMPNMAMSMYNEMLLLENACTDKLQSSLNAGWRIIAACPQPDQRRPDYILGRFNPDYDADAYASRL